MLKLGFCLILAAVEIWIPLRGTAQSQQFVSRITTYAGVGVVRLGQQVCNIGPRGGCIYPQTLTPSGYTGDGGPATAAQLGVANGIAVDLGGNLFVTIPKFNRVRKITPDGVISTIAGNGTAGCSGDGGPATAAALNAPQAVAVDASGNVFIADRQNQRVRKVDSNGIISTIAGSGGQCATAAPAIDPPTDLKVDASGNLFICTVLNGPLVVPPSNTQKVLKLDTSGTLTAIAETDNSFNGNCVVAVDAAGDIFYTSGQQVFKRTPSGQAAAFAGTTANESSGSGDGGPATVVIIIASGLAVDSAGNLLITDGLEVRSVSPGGILSTISGAGFGGLNGILGDFGPAASGSFYGTAGIAVDSAGNVFTADVNNARIRKIAYEPNAPVPQTISFSKSLNRTSTNNAPALLSGHGIVSSESGNSGVSGLAIFGERSGGVLVSEAGVPASPLIQSGRIYAEIGGSINTGIAISNPYDRPAQISFFFTDANGTDIGVGTTSIAGRSKIAVFLTDPPFYGPTTFAGTFTFNSSLPLGIIALRGRLNERSDFLMTTLPAADLTAQAAGSAVTFPQFADGLGWFTQIVLVNPGDSTISGTVQFLNSQGAPAAISVNGQAGSNFTYSIPPRTSRTWVTSGTANPVATGSISATPNAGSAAPVGVAIFSLRFGGITVTEAGVPAGAASTAFRLYAETGGDFPEIGSIQSGFAISNTSSATVNITLELDQLDGTPTGVTGAMSLPQGSQTALLLNQLPGFGSMPNPFQGMLRLKSSASVAIVGLRIRVNERGETLMTTTPATDESTPVPGVPLLFPHVVDSGGFTTQFLLYSSDSVAPTGILELYDANGGPLGIFLQ